MEDAEGRQLIVGQRVTQNGGEQVAGTDCIPPSPGSPEATLADADGEAFGDLFL